jgi:site-specific recombinase XerD
VAADNGVDVLAATRPHIELFRACMEQRGLAASTIDRRLSTVCGFYRFAHIDGRIASNPAQYGASVTGPPFRFERARPVRARQAISVTNAAET